MRTWDEFLPEIMPFVPECPDVVVRGAVRDTAMEFCEETLCWQDTMDARVEVSERDIPLSTDDDDIVIVRPLRIGTEDDGELTPKSTRWLDRNVADWRYETGTPVYYTLPMNGVLWLAPHTDTAFTLDLQVALKPGPDSTEGPDDLFTDHRAAIQAGAIARLCVMPGKAWSNPALVTMFQGVYLAKRAAAAVRAARGNTNAPIRVASDHRF
jgi:hypothetical protein